MWALNGLQFLQGISICSSPVLSRHHSVDIFFSAWSTFSSFFFSFTSLHPGVFSCSLICSHGGATSTTVMLAVACVWVHYGAAWQNLSGTRQPLIFSHRGHPAALLLPTQCHINSWESKQQQSITPELTCLAQTLIILKLFFMLGKRFRGVTDLLTCER